MATKLPPTPTRREGKAEWMNKYMTQGRATTFIRWLQFNFYQRNTTTYYVFKKIPQQMSDKDFFFSLIDCFWNLILIPDHHNQLKRNVLSQKGQLSASVTISHTSSLSSSPAHNLSRGVTRAWLRRDQAGFFLQGAGSILTSPRAKSTVWRAESHLGKDTRAAAHARGRKIDPRAAVMVSDSEMRLRLCENHYAPLFFWNSDG